MNKVLPLPFWLSTYTSYVWYLSQHLTNQRFILLSSDDPPCPVKYSIKSVDKKCLSVMYSKYVDRELNLIRFVVRCFAFSVREMPNYSVSCWFAPWMGFLLVNPCVYLFHFRFNSTTSATPHESIRRSRAPPLPHPNVQLIDHLALHSSNFTLPCLPHKLLTSRPGGSIPDISQLVFHGLVLELDESLVVTARKMVDVPSHEHVFGMTVGVGYCGEETEVVEGWTRDCGSNSELCWGWGGWW